MAKRGFMDGYRTYSPEVEGFGDARSWRQAFGQRMGLDEARRRVGRETPESILGITPGASWETIRRAYRTSALACHPDRCAVHGLEPAIATERFKRLTAAFTILAERHGK